MRKITEIFITVKEISGSEMSELCVKAGDGFNDSFVTTGFESVKECHEYAKLLATSLKLPDECIDADVFDNPTLTRIK